MPTAKELFDAGQLQAAIEELTREVKANPADASRRTFLFALLCFAGEWDRADKQLDVIGHQSAKAEIGALMYRNCLKAERARRQLFSEGLMPNFLVEPPGYIGVHLQAIDRIREGDFDQARQLLERAEEERPALAGTFNGQAFEDFRDSDDLAGPALELIVQDRYIWLPFEQISRIEFEPPQHLRDLIWAVARVEAENINGEVFVPVLYEDSCRHADDRIRLGRMTDWRLLGEGLNRAAGSRLFLVNGEDQPMLEARTIEFVRAEA